MGFVAANFAEVAGAASMDASMAHCADFVIEAGTLREYHGASPEVTIPDGVKAIGKECFKGMSIEKVFCPDSVIEVRKDAFKDCEKLTELHLSGNLHRLDPALEGCKSLKYLAIPPALKECSAYSFYTAGYDFEIHDYTLSVDFIDRRITPVLSRNNNKVSYAYSIDGVDAVIERMSRIFVNGKEFTKKQMLRQGAINNGWCTFCGWDFGIIRKNRCSHCGKRKDY